MPAATNIALLCLDNLLLQQYAELLHKFTDLHVSIKETSVDSFTNAPGLKDMHIALLMDLETVEAVRGFLNRSFPSIRIVCNCLFKTRAEIASVLKVNVRGIVFRDRVEAHELVQAIRNVASTGCDFQVLYRQYPDWRVELEKYCQTLPHLTENEYTSLILLAGGMEAKEMATVLNVSTRTVNRFLESVREKTHARTYAETVARAIYLGWMPANVAARQNAIKF